MDKKIILASASPRRREILTNLGLDFDIIPADIEETIDPFLDPAELVKNLALQKAAHVAKQIGYPAIIIGSDTTVVIDNKILGKPANFNEAFDMLSTLSGRTHTVFTGICVIDTSENKIITDYEATEVTFKELSPEEIKDYISTGEPMDKAGSYGIQAIGSTLVVSVNGCYNNIVGLPVYKLSETLKEFGVDILKSSVLSN